MVKFLVIISSFKTKKYNELNKFKINNLPLSIIKYEELKKSNYKNNFNILIATDNIKFSGIFLSNRINIPLLIPSKINNKIEKIEFILNWYKNNSDEKFNYIIYLPSNYILLNYQEIDNIIDTFLKNKNHYDMIQTFENVDVKKLKSIYQIKNNNCLKINLNISKNGNYCILNDCMCIYKINISEMKLQISNKILPIKVSKIFKIEDENNFDSNINLINNNYQCNNKIIKIKVLSNIHYNSEKGYFGFDASILDKYLKSSNWIEPNTFSCYKNDFKNNFNVTVWRKKLDNISTAHGRHKDKNIKIKFKIGEELYLKYNDLSFYNKIKKYKDENIFSTDLTNIFKNKKVIICGNGPNGYEKHKSNKYIDSHDIVIRVNSYKNLHDICGSKTTFHFMNSLNENFHTKDDPIFSVVNECDYILINNEKHFYDNLKKLKKIKKPIITYNTKLIDKISFELFNSKTRMTGATIIILMILLKMIVNFELNYIGFSDGHNLVKNQQTYYWGNRLIKSKKHLKLHNSHNFDKQYKLINILDYLI